MPQREVLEKDRRRAIQQWTSQPLATSDDVDQAALVQRFQHAANGDAANLFDVGTPDRLAIGNDGQRLQGGGGETLWPRRQLGALDGLGVLGARKELPATGNLLKLHAVPIDVVMLAKLVDRRVQRGRRGLGIERG